MTSPGDLKAYRDFKWIVADERMLGGSLAIRGLRFSVAHILECFACGMTVDDIDRAFGITIPREALPEVFAVASELAADARVAA